MNFIKIIKRFVHHLQLIPFYIQVVPKIDVKKNWFPVRSTNPRMKVLIKKGEGASFELNGKLKFDAFQGNFNPVYIELNAGARLVIRGDFIIGAGTRIWLDRGACLDVGGRENESGSGITENSRIMVAKKVAIGKDFIGSWNVFITDCDWHDVDGVENVQDTSIGNHVWVTPNCSILKGSRIGDNCIIGTGSVTSQKDYPSQSFVAGNPARVLGIAGKWNRDLNLHE